MLHKKYMIQKTFRLDSRVNDDFETLCEILERTQNDLANTAITNLLNDNKYWLAQNIFVEYAETFLANGETADFEIEGIHVLIKELEDENIKFEVIHKDEQGNIIQEVKEIYDKNSNYIEEITKTLRYFGEIVDFDSKIVQDHLKSNKNYQ